jgi:nitrate reductase beta subunit
VLKKMMAVRIFRRKETVGDINAVESALTEAGLTEEQANGIYRLTALAPLEERFVIPPAHREEAIEMTKMVLVEQGETGFGFTEGPSRM